MGFFFWSLMFHSQSCLTLRAVLGQWAYKYCHLYNSLINTSHCSANKSTSLSHLLHLLGNQFQPNITLFVKNLKYILFEPWQSKEELNNNVYASRI